ncbi:MAG: RsmD family RNA methyltransferase [Bacteroidales bacterium]|nr:RsmD family RNA methyltransferase [Bacteroidales bacterium]
MRGNTFVDLTGGFGVDASFFSESFEKGIYVERQKELVEIVRHNFAALNILNVDIVHSDALHYLEKLSAVDCIFIDPSRRSFAGNRVMLIQDCDPDLISFQKELLNKADKVLVKLSPMLDVKSVLHDIRKIGEIHILSVDNDCKELLLMMNKEQKGEPVVTCVNFKGDGLQSDSFYYSDEVGMSAVLAKDIKAYLYEPNVSVMKAGFFKSISKRYDVEKLHINSHLYTSGRLISNFPGRIFEIVNTSSMNKKDLKYFLSDVEKANISVRNFPLSVDELRKKIKIREGGALYLFATTLADGKRVLIKTRQLFSFD